MTVTGIFTKYENEEKFEKVFKNRKELFLFREKHEEEYELEDYLYSSNHIGFVNVYEITREYGGPEEGGWYYNSLRCIEAIPCRLKNSDDMIAWAKEEYKHIKHGNIYSVLGGSELEIYWEEKPSDSETKNKPYYS